MTKLMELIYNYTDAWYDVLLMLQESWAGTGTAEDREIARLTLIQTKRELEDYIESKQYD